MSRRYFSSLRSKRFQSSYCAKVRAEAKKKVFCSCPSFLNEPREETLATQANDSEPIRARGIIVKYRDSVSVSQINYLPKPKAESNN